MNDLKRALVAEALGSLLLAGVVVGSGIMAVRLTSDDATALVANTGATAAILFVLITALGPISGAHFNPAVTVVMVALRAINVRRGALYVAVQILGCVAGVILAHAMFDLPLLQQSTTERSGGSQMLSEGVATFALLGAILLVSSARAQSVASAVSLTIVAGYWWTASTSFANPAITIARSLSDTFSGIRPEDAPWFIAAQLAGALAATGVCGWLTKPRSAPK